MRRFFRATAVAALLMVWAIPAHAAELTGGCTLEARSFDGAGNALDTAVVPGSDEGTQQNPFRVAWDGRVDFRFNTGTTVFQNNNWSVFVENLPVAVLKGQDDNPMDLDESGSVTVGDKVPGGVRFTGLIYVNGNIVGNGGTSRCDGGGWVQIIGDPVGTIPWILFLLLIVLGALFLIATPYTIDWEEGGYSAMPGGPVR
jgi:hypothetical protein